MATSTTGAAVTNVFSGEVNSLRTVLNLLKSIHIKNVKPLFNLVYD